MKHTRHKNISWSFVFLVSTLLSSSFSLSFTNVSEKDKKKASEKASSKSKPKAEKLKADTNQSEKKSEVKPEAAVEKKEEKKEVLSYKEFSSQDFVSKSWEASHQQNADKLNELVGKCVELYGAEADIQQKQLTAFPERGQEINYQSLNDVGTCLFVQAEFVMNTGKTEEAVKLFQSIIDRYKWSQSWDPRGWYWSVAEKSQDSIDVLTGKAEEETQSQTVKANRTRPILHTPGTEDIIDYTKYGKFLNAGTAEYKYSITDVQGLSKAIGEGIYPNSGDIYNNPRYRELKSAGSLNGSHWDFVNTDDLETAYFKWVTAAEPWGVRLFYIGTIFEKSRMYNEALKAYHSLIVHFPKTVAWTYWQTPWYPAQAAVAKIRHILRMHPELNLTEMWMNVDVKNSFDNDVKNDIIITFPGKLEHKNAIDLVKEKLPFNKTEPLGKVERTLGKGKVRLVQYENKHWQLMVEGKPYIIKGITYAPTKIGESPDKGTLKNWMEQDTNQNGLADGPYDSWVDTNGNNEQDADEPVVGDFKLMKEMGLNTLRIYHHPQIPNREFLRKMHNEFGFRVIMGNFMGKYALQSGATWVEGTDYDNPVHRKNLLNAVKEMVMEYKDEPYILMWLLGNENNYGVACNADKKPESYYKFVDEVAQWIKSVDPHHPVAISNGDALYLDIFAKNAPHVDAFAANVYRGDYGFGSYWQQVLESTGKAAFVTEFGSPAFAKHLSNEEAEVAQADYHKGNWMDIQENMAGTPTGIGNALGGVVFEWMDEWWKNYEPFRHDRKSDAVGPFPGGYYFEEWFGIVGQGNGRHSPFMRHLRKTYFLYKELWNK